MDQYKHNDCIYFTKSNEVHHGIIMCLDFTNDNMYIYTVYTPHFQIKIKYEDIIGYANHLKPFYDRIRFCMECLTDEEVKLYRELGYRPLRYDSMSNDKLVELNKDNPIVVEVIREDKLFSKNIKFEIRQGGVADYVYTLTDLMTSLFGLGVPADKIWKYIRKIEETHYKLK